MKKNNLLVLVMCIIMVFSSIAFASDIKYDVKKIEGDYEYIYPSKNELLLVERYGKVGYINKSGELVIPMEYDASSDIYDRGLFAGNNYTEDLLLMKKNGKFGFIDKTGNTIIPFAYDYSSVFVDGLAHVSNIIGKDEQGDYIYRNGYIDKTGNHVIPMYYNSIGTFQNGLACASKYVDTEKGTKTIKYGFIDRNGNEVIPFIYDFANDFSDNLALVVNDMKYGFVDVTGNIAVPLEYDLAYSFKDGFAAVAKTNEKNKFGNNIYLWGFIDKNGAEISKLEYQQVMSFSSGLAVVKKDDNFGYINSKGEIVVPLIYGKARSFEGNLAVVSKIHYKDSNGNIVYKSGIINTNGKLLLPLRYEDIKSFENGYALVVDNGKMSFINSEGALTPDLKYDMIFPFSEGFARVARNGGAQDNNLLYLYGYIKENGNESISLRFSEALDFKEGLAATRALTSNEEKWGYIDKIGYKTIPFTFDGADSFSDGLAKVEQSYVVKENSDPAKVEKANKVGFINKYGKIVVTIEYEYASKYIGGVALAYKNKTWYIISDADKVFENNSKPNNNTPTDKPSGTSKPDDNKTADTKNDAPSDWATQTIESAKSNNLIPEQLMSKYQTNISRSEFCDIVIKLIELKASKSIDSILADSNLKVNSFEDTDSKNILAANALGIVNGKGNGIFAPNGELTREEAAVIMTNTANYLKFSSKVNNDFSLDKFIDKEKISSWAITSIEYVAKNGIMNGKGDNIGFDPQGHFTREESIITIYRLFN